jgi:hypothetical protein
MISQFAQNEQNMNAVERVLHYSELPSEGAPTTPDDPPLSWPEKGNVTFSNVEMSYREGLPLVLKNISFQVNPGEKVTAHPLFNVSNTYVDLHRLELLDALGQARVLCYRLCSGNNCANIVSSIN